MSPITSLSSRLQPILDGRKRNAATITTHCGNTSGEQNTTRLAAKTRNFDNLLHLSEVVISSKHPPTAWSGNISLSKSGPTTLIASELFSKLPIQSVHSALSPPLLIGHQLESAHEILAPSVGAWTRSTFASLVSALSSMTKTLLGSLQLSWRRTRQLTPSPWRSSTGDLNT